MTKALYLLAAALVATLAFAACSGDDDDADLSDSDGVREITVQMTDELRFDPQEINVRSGERVRLTVDNSRSTVIHDFTIDDIAVTNVVTEGGSSAGGHDMGHSTGDTGEAALHIAVDAGEVGVIEFTPTESGEYDALCTVTGHADAGMVAQLVVE